MPKFNLKKFVKNHIQPAIATIVSLATLIGLAFAAENHYAKQGDIVLVQLRLEQKIIQDQRNDLQNQVWKLEDRVNGDICKMPPEMLEDYRKKKKELEDKEKELDIIQKEHLEQQKNKGK